ncbi:peptidoglycan-binding protein [Streptomyces sp. LUP30]|uniref:peptidoglycan-binding domain-containing protein n=1 Tax=Streptomyces sp. LUP30 TaxID=1890285 RepID=UPI00114D32CA|nr:peptidoglycan-binding domain-containing protein [Streptomyces sp. LUP30]
MRTTRRASLASLAAVAALAVPAVVGGSAGTASAQVASKTVAAEVACTGFTNVSVGGGWYLHVPSAGSGNYNCVVARGMNSLPVLVVQESLNACFGQGIAEDRDFGSGTEQAVKNAQTQINRNAGSHVLDVDGRFGPKTSSKFLFQAYDYTNGQNGRHTGVCYTR